jgi:hypothetical protein
MAKRDDYENTFRTIEQSLGSSSSKNPAAALGRQDRLKESKAKSKKFTAAQPTATTRRAKDK